MGDMIERDAVLEILTSASGMRQKTIAAIAALPAVTVLASNPVDASQTPDPVAKDPAAIREAALREALKVCKMVANSLRDDSEAEAVGAMECALALSDLITEKPHDRA